MSKAALKKSLGAMTKSEIIETVCELYEVRREAKDYLDYWIDPNPDRALLEFKETVDKMFFYSTGKTRSQPSATDLRRMVKYFSTLVFDSEKTAELLLHIADRQYQWVTRKSGGVVQSEKAVRRAYDNARNYVEGAALEEVYGLRLDNLKEKIDEFFKDPPRRRRGWGWRWR